MYRTEIKIIVDKKYRDDVLFSDEIKLAFDLETMVKRSNLNNLTLVTYFSSEDKLEQLKKDLGKALWSKTKAYFPIQIDVDRVIEEPHEFIDLGYKEYDDFVGDNPDLVQEL